MCFRATNMESHMYGGPEGQNTTPFQKTERHFRKHLFHEIGEIFVVVYETLSFLKCFRVLAHHGTVAKTQ